MQQNLEVILDLDLDGDTKVLQAARKQKFRALQKVVELWHSIKPIEGQSQCFSHVTEWQNLRGKAVTGKIK